MREITASSQTARERPYAPPLAPYPRTPRPKLPPPRRTRRLVHPSRLTLHPTPYALHTPNGATQGPLLPFLSSHAPPTFYAAHPTPYALHTPCQAHTHGPKPRPTARRYRALVICLSGTAALTAPAGLCSPIWACNSSLSTSPLTVPLPPTAPSTLVPPPPVQVWWH